MLRRTDRTVSYDGRRNRIAVGDRRMPAIRRNWLLDWEQAMTEKLKPSSLAEALFYADWPEGDDKWEQHNKKGPDAAARRYMRLAEVAAAWNTRATGWRTDWENAHTQNLLRVCRYISASYIWVYAYAFKNQKDTWITESGNILHWTPTHFQEITPPDSEAPHD